MDSHLSADFRRCRSKLPREIRRAATEYYKRWKKDPFAPTFFFKSIDSKNDIWSLRIGDHYRAFGVRDNDEITWFWIGTHEEANGLIKRGW